MKIQNMQYTNGDVLEMALKWLAVLCVMFIFFSEIYQTYIL